MRNIYVFLFTFLSFSVFSQSNSIKGILQDANGVAIEFANVALYSMADSSLQKAEVSDASGVFNFQGVNAGEYYMTATYVGLEDYKKDISLIENQQIDLGILKFETASVNLAETTVTAQRVMVEVKPDRTVFNVEGTINSAGQDAIELLRKAPGVTVDNNDYISVLGRTGVLVYVDGKRLPLAGEDLKNYLQSLPAEQIDRFDIITNPGAKYEAEGNAGIIDIRLKRDKSLGTNGTISSTYGKGRYATGNTNLALNYRNKKVNAFGTLGYGKGKSFMEMAFLSNQNGFILDEEVTFNRNYENYNFRGGVDFFINKNSIIGILVGGGNTDNTNDSDDRIEIFNQSSPSIIDSILIAQNNATSNRNRNSYNLNYRYSNPKGRTFNVDFDYGTFSNDTDRFQPNRYYDALETNLLSEKINNYETPTDIDIYTLKIDYEQNLFGGKLGFGTKVSRVVSDNTFLVFDFEDGIDARDDALSNIFDYDENVYAGYINFSRSLGQKWNFSAGIRGEQTDANGNLQAFLPELEEPPVEIDYLSWFPSAGLTYQASRNNSFSLNYGRRINRPDYNVLNPFNSRISELSFEKGNPFLSPEIVNNIELGWTYKYRYNFKIAYSKTTDQITRLIAPDDVDPRAGFITWENLAEQNIFSLSISAPIDVTKWWSAYFNFSASHLDNQADYEEGATVDLQAFTYNVFQQHTFSLPKGFKAEISSWYGGPGIWGGVFEYDPMYSINLGLQKRFLQDKMNVKISANDIFYQTGWSGQSEFNGLVSAGSGNWDSRKVTLSVSYRFGNQQVKNSRSRTTGMEDEAKRVTE